MANDVWETVIGCERVIGDVTVTAGINSDANEAPINSALISAGCLIFVIVLCYGYQHLNYISCVGFEMSVWIARLWNITLGGLW
jgi:hypothetical protein